VLEAERASGGRKRACAPPAHGHLLRGGRCGRAPCWADSASEAGGVEIVDRVGCLSTRLASTVRWALMVLVRRQSEERRCRLAARQIWMWKRPIAGP
jgi:hypothetical protein